MTNDEVELSDADLAEKLEPPTTNDPNLKTTGQLQKEVRRPSLRWILTSVGAVLAIVGAYFALGLFPGTTRENVEERLARVTGPAVPPEEGGPTILAGGALRWEAEDYTGGATPTEGTDYHDTTPGNSGDAQSMTDVDVGSCRADGYSVGWIASGEWLQYSFTGAGTYSLRVTYAGNSRGTAHVEVDGVQVGTTFHLPRTGGWDRWSTISFDELFTVADGPHTVRFVSHTDGYNLDSFDFVPAALVAVAEPPPAVFEEAAEDDLALPADEGDDSPDEEDASEPENETNQEVAVEEIASEDPPPAEDDGVGPATAPCTGPQDTEAARIACLDQMIALARSLRRSD